ncbi:alpha/beta hydrolase fold protein [Pseudopedobacter saltans DSM 12145]|uniref:Alpha/beta hydrolase fold protein n=1 Tax=Pseudopedobacter saltans (strain ATCC 51119 / DSM 12145 / JCM 21818 / CCUG 39354 / LMG 10337 / NBRC 100064 / NCIMB 13643) TaxID=762903 RepID=F0S824_PSESL|nr:alpha/beta hydrolase [Pseudopedobacter saltans]ADY51245.1 alpha/beta hydrolase fold protein [Pseudopedobacter saltans DSM 12145]
MTDHYFGNEFVSMHYYKFGSGDQNMLCFHGYGMHGKQFKILEENFGHQYTFYGFDLFFHKETKLKNQTLAIVKQGISKKELSELFVDFCDSVGIDKFSMIAYSMGSHYATTLVEEVPHKINEIIIAAPASFRPGKIITFLSLNTIGNRLLEYLALSDKGMIRLLSVLKKISVVDKTSYEILYKEISTFDLRFAFYACLSYKRFLTLDTTKFINAINAHQIKSYFVFGERDRNYPQKIGKSIIPKISNARQVVISENHDMINQKFAEILLELLNDN